jgi:hypothetical protein
MVGAVMCWQKGETTKADGKDGAGHVAIVEQVNADGSVLTSESGWNKERYWWTSTRYKGADGNWGAGGDYKFQGFIYSPRSSAAPSTNIYTDNKYLNKSLDPSNTDLEKMKPTAQYIWQYLGSRGWTVNAVAALCGNIHEESNFSTCVWENTIKGSYIDSSGNHVLNSSALGSFKGGYGLVQWTPYTKYMTWCKNGSTAGNANGTGRTLNFWEIDTQLMRIEAEVRASTGAWIEGLSQWIKNKTYGYDLSFTEFISSTSDVYWLAGAFAFCYERPAAIGTASGREKLKKDRGRYGEYWFNYLKTLPPPSEIVTVVQPVARLDDLKANNCTDTSTTISFLSTDITSAKYSVNNGSSYSINVSNDVSTFKLSKLVPNTSYTVAITAESKDSTTIVKKLSFETMQAIPKSFDKVELQKKDSALLSDSFNLKISPSTVDFGYWKTTKNNSHGYCVQLIVNGQLFKEKTVTAIPTAIKLKDYFGYTSKIGDIIQIGIRVWVKDGSGKVLFDSDCATTSNTFCFLKRPVIPYLNC